MSLARENGTLRSNRRFAVPDLLQEVAVRAPVMPRAAWKETPLPRRSPQSQRPITVCTALHPSREAAGKAPSGSAPSRSHRADRKWACRVLGAEEGAGPVRIPRSPLLQRRRPVMGRSSEQFLHALLHRCPSAPGGSNQKNRVVAGERADNFFPSLGIHRRGKRLRTAGRSFQHEHVLRRANIQQEFLERPRKRSLWGSFFGCRGREW